MGELGLQGLPTRRKLKGLGVNLASAADLVKREFARNAPNRLWMTDITEHPAREGKVYCCVVLDAFSRKVIGWSIDSTQTASLVTNALGMAITARKLADDAIIHSDRGVQGGFNWCSQRFAVEGIVDARRAPRRACASRASCVVCC